MQGKILGFIKNRPGNLLGNGAFDFFQRALSTISAGSHPTYGYNAPDRWANAVSGAGPTSYVLQRVVDSPNGLSKYAGQLIVNEPASTSKAYIAQRIESVFSQAISGGKTSFSLWVKSPACREVTVRLATADVEDDFSAITQFDSKIFVVTNDNSWQKLSWNGIPVPVGGSNGVQVEIEFTDWSITGAVTNVNFTQIMMNEGPAVAKFERAGGSYIGDLSLCQRYFEKSYDLDLPLGTTTGGGANNDMVGRVPSAAQLHFTMMFKTMKRLVPIGTFFSPATGASGVIRNDSTSTDVVRSPDRVGQWSMNMNAATTINQQLSWHWSADAEL